MMNSVKFNLDLAQEAETVEEVRILIEKLKRICQKKNWEYSIDKAKIVIHYPIQKEIGFDFNALAFLEELKSEDVELKQSIFPNV